ncbi:hypothetical protein T459_24056 [Capsicum annuum]|uniref:Uncharacterized protein n=1 Tax=Capsicum annuum TaxID=4072 RepID=A0A2G2YUG4_CAPAN|nr:hypothetical protein T459_24056 [Capsicum annuum]
MNQILCCFDVHSSATAYQQCKVKIIFLSLMHSTIKVDDTIKMKGEVVLADMLQKSLKGKRWTSWIKLRVETYLKVQHLQMKHYHLSLRPLGSKSQRNVTGYH